MDEELRDAERRECGGRGDCVALRSVAQVIPTARRRRRLRGRPASPARGRTRPPARPRRRDERAAATRRAPGGGGAGPRATARGGRRPSARTSRHDEGRRRRPRRDGRSRPRRPRACPGQPPPACPTRRYSTFHAAIPRRARSTASGVISVRSQPVRQKPPWRRTTHGHGPPSAAGRWRFATWSGCSP